MSERPWSPHAEFIDVWGGSAAEAAEEIMLAQSRAAAGIVVFIGSHMKPYFNAVADHWSSKIKS